MKNNTIQPNLVAFEVTRRCRFNCRHCRANAGADRSKDLTAAQCKKILASLAQFNKCLVILTGGEPMERSDIYELIRYGTTLGLRMVMATCGYAINEASIAKLKKAGLLALSFSLDGAEAKTHDAFRQTKGAFDLVLKAAKIAKSAGMRFQINTTVCKINIDEIDAIAKLTEKLGAYCFNPFILVPTGRGKKIAGEILEPEKYEKLLHKLLDIKLKSKIDVRLTCGPQFARLYHRSGTQNKNYTINGCMGGRGFGFISYRGDVQTCGFLDISAGNLVENNFNFGKIWQGSQFLQNIRNLSAYEGKCGICEYVGICGGCRARAYAMSGNYLAADPVCIYQPEKSKTTSHLTKLQKQLCNLLQDGLPVCEKPFDNLAKSLNCDSDTVLNELKYLKKIGILRRISTLINYQALGSTGTLVAARVPPKKLDKVVQEINHLENVSHNYLRKHRYNLWFTLQEKSSKQIKETLTSLSARFGIDFHSLPVKRTFKLNVRFDAENKKIPPGNPPKIQKIKPVKLSCTQKLVLSKLQHGLEVTEKPFDFLCNGNLKIGGVLKIIRKLIKEGLIRRIAGIVDHRRLGYAANIMFCCKVGRDKIAAAGKRLAASTLVSHCYERKVFKNWPYNLFAMMHGENLPAISNAIDEFTKTEKINSFALLPTLAEFKKQPVKHRLP